MSINYHINMTAAVLEEFPFEEQIARPFICSLCCNDGPESDEVGIVLSCNHEDNIRHKFDVKSSMILEGLSLVEDQQESQFICVHLFYNLHKHYHSVPLFDM